MASRPERDVPDELCALPPLNSPLYYCPIYYIHLIFWVPSSFRAPRGWDVGKRLEVGLVFRKSWSGGAWISNDRSYEWEIQGQAEGDGEMGTSGSRLPILKRKPGSAKHVTFVILSLLSIQIPAVESYPPSRRPLINLVFPVLCGIQVRTDNVFFVQGFSVFGVLRLIDTATLPWLGKRIWKLFTSGAWLGDTSCHRCAKQKTG